MKQTMAEQKIVIETKTTSVTCDCCGKTIKGEHASDMGDITDVVIQFGYGSRFDTDIWKMDICDDCLEKWVSTFKYPIEKREGY